MKAITIQRMQLREDKDGIAAIDRGRKILEHFDELSQDLIMR